MIQVPVKRSLQERMREATKGSRASLFPSEPKKPKKVKEPEIVPDLRDLVSSHIVRTKILRLSQKIYEWGVAEREAKAGRKPLVEALKILLESEGIDAEKFMADELRVSMYDVSRSRIDRDKLLAHNVSPKVIAACTERKASKAIRVGLANEKEEKGEGDE